ncbi:uncharacterized protein N7479_001593 [Penicillium vulpinum]|uniref:uncharacterized protein n=1 Tax=Penicillium vulpinum TaxID=29845 RepID=UPI002547E750|nr:uncharacterized protein N7479_001593 [Penicillium vulpinum]KAJ5971675.1 hypothetical protein N7479_001593 [Penicillium vulpinum]
MSKRGAEGDHMRREEESMFGMASTPDEKPLRATQAQLANRKIKDVRKRRAPTPTTGGGAASFNPFASVAPASAPAPTQSTGFTFGQTQSQSFPGASSGPSQGGMFSSGTNGQAGGQASFSFGAGPTSFGTAPPSNPFSVDTSFGGSSQSTTNGFGFGGFNAGNQSTPSFGGFGAQQNTSTPTKPTIFGQSASHMTSPADDSMQTSPDTKPKGTSMFASKPAPGPSALSNPFSNLSGQTPSSNLFAPSQTTAPEKVADKPAETQPFKLFGSTPAASKPSDGEKQQPTASNPFANLSGQAPTSSANIFAPKTTAGEQTPAKPAEAAKPFGALFGSTSGSQPSGPASNLFAPKPATEEPKAINPFATLSAPSSLGTFSSPKVTGTESSGKATAAQPFMFGTPTASKVSEAGKEQAAMPAFGNMFSPKPAVENVAAKPAADQPFKSMFGTPAASKVLEAGKEQTAPPAFGNLFSPKPVAENTGAKPSEDKPKSVFGTPAGTTPTGAEKEPSAASSVFAPKVTSEEQAPVPAKTSQFGSVFGASPALSKPEDKTAQATPSNPFANLSGQNAFGNPFAPKPTEQAVKPQAPSTSLFGASTPIDNNKQNKDNNIAANPFTVEPKALNEPQTEGSTKTTTPQVSFSQPSRDHKSSCLPVPSSSSLPSSTSTVSNTFTAPDPDSLFPRSDYPVSIEYPLPSEDSDEMPLKRLFPEDKTGELRMRADLLVKIGILTEAFKREIAKCDPMKDDIDEVLILYAELRRDLGVPIGSISPAEEAKRAAIDERDAAKEAPDGCSPPRIPSPPACVPRSFEPVPPKKHSVGSTTSSKFAQSFSAPAPASATTSASASPAPVAGPSSPTAAPATTSVAPSALGVPKFGDAATSTAAPVIPKFDGAATSTAASAFQIPKFGDAATSTAPSAFQIPKFGAGATGADFAAQFKSQSDKSEAEAKAKRKAEEFDSEEEDEEEWERKDAERQREKREKVQAAANKRAVFIPGVGFKFADDDSAAPKSAEEPATSAPSAAPSATSANPATAPQDVEEPDHNAPTPPPAFEGKVSHNTTPSIFKEPPFTAWPTSGAKGAPSLSSSQHQPQFPKSSPDASEFSTLVGTATRSPADAALFGGKPGSSSSFLRKPVPASQNIFGGLKPTSPKRKASADGSDEDDDSPAKKVKSTQNIFGPKPTTSENIFGPKPTTSQSLFGQPKPTSQNIFGGPKPTSPKRKASADGSDNEDDSSAKQTKLSPPPSAGASMFGRVSSAPAPAPLTNSFPPSAIAPASVPSTQPSSTPTEDEDGEPGEIFDLTKGNGGEEEETVVFEDKSRVFKLESKWLPKGTGPVRLLKHPVTGRARIVCRAEPSGKVTLNILLKKEFDYKLTTNSVQFLVPDEAGKLTHWAVRVKTERLQEFHNLIQEIKN